MSQKPPFTFWPQRRNDFPQIASENWISLKICQDYEKCVLSRHSKQLPPIIIAQKSIKPGAGAEGPSIVSVLVHRGNPMNM